MKYFNTLPSVITSDYNGNTLTLKNILTRATLLPQLETNPLLFYTYTSQEGDTPETVAYKYYGDQYRYWIVLYGNGSLDPQFDWPLSSQQFSKYIVNKYMSVATNEQYTPTASNTANAYIFSQVMSYTQNTKHHYDKIITTTDNITKTQSIKTIEIDANSANQVVTGITTVTFSDGSSATQSVSVNPVSIYDYENTLNENKRNIKLINNSYVGAMESQFQSLMSK